LNKDYNFINNLEEKLLDFKYNYLKIYQKKIYYLFNNVIIYQNDKFLNFYSKLKKRFYHEYLYLNNNEFNNYLKSKKYINFLQILNLHYNRLLLFLQLTYKENIFIYNLVNIEENVEEYYYYFVNSYNKKERVKLYKMHKDIMHDILSYFN
jgi:hypothetical protein